MSKKNYYSMTDSAIAKELAQRLEQLRLEANIPQKDIAKESGISEGTYRNAIKGKMKLEVLISILRVLGKLDNIDSFLPATPFSPIELLKLEGRKRQRASSPHAVNNTRVEEDDQAW